MVPFPKRLLVVFSFIGFFFILSHFTVVSKFVKQPIARYYRLFLCAILFLGIFLRVFWCVAMPTYFENNFANSLTCDESDRMAIYSYQIYKQGIPTEEDGSLSVRRPVGYPYLMGGLYRLLGYRPNLFKIVQIAADSFLIILAFFLAQSLFQNYTISIPIAFLFAIYPLNWLSTGVFLDEFLFFPAWFAALYFISENIRKKEVKRTVLIGLLLGLATAFRTIALHTPLLVFIVYLIQRTSYLKAIRKTIFCYVIIYAVNAPWALITYQHYGVPCFFSNANACFYGTLNDRAGWGNGSSLAEVDNVEFVNEKNPVKQISMGVRLAAEWVIKNPSKAARFFVFRTFQMYGFNHEDEVLERHTIHFRKGVKLSEERRSFIAKYKNWAYSFVAILGLLGFFVFLWKRRIFFLRFPGLLLLFLICAYWILVFGFWYGYRKYRWPIELILIYPSAFFLYWIASLRINLPLRLFGLFDSKADHRKEFQKQIR
ncbi:MAG: hypothetical protein A3G33_03115 [Omnitrophica bacterium RIFCSPLOWO2_12_FULL_44_17]|uniref:Uncharacterized protein n=1 Tax=Candidatus Danuiimicrobium aquiferis TaxID=1801832 RepID=A0A1G1KUR7_9BACT|nr:MAG: hypothetical protein A3B72_06660 [Omnitrophica bacterium RIFCSPHIGHO2_02_FULL_45_28]OGW96309.1 MAG: hypothetical protein A3G33_03115 [Omnitrophica bacterium RIFCSPLOWO2_12_FULL_44_17]OGX04258.1 MAG: hypothetical protein A3J12_10920 [Omnitrophica bacterium RIFCSPLOWO2_02_FULL_44_11]